MPAVLEPRPPSVALRASQGTSGGAGGTHAAGPPPAPAGAPEAPHEAERPDPLAAEVARSVRELRVGAGLSERAAARLLGTSQTQLRRMEDPRYLPSLRSLARLAAAYGHRLRVAFESKERPAAKAAKPAAKARGGEAARASAAAGSERARTADTARPRPRRRKPRPARGRRRT